MHACCIMHRITNFIVMITFTGARGNLLQFGGCPISEARSLTFTLANYSDTSIIRFKWPSVAGILNFTPSLGHIYPGSSKDITATLMSTKPKVCKNQKFAGKYWEIKYTTATEHVRRAIAIACTVHVLYIHCTCRWILWIVLMSKTSSYTLHACIIIIKSLHTCTVMYVHCTVVN